MRRIEHDVALKDHHSFRMDVCARFWAEFSSVEELAFFYRDSKWAGTSKLILSGGSNVLFVDDFPGLVLHPAIRGLEVLDENADSVSVRVGAGENWDEFVQEAVLRGWHGIENLSWIPGCVGACPIQNIGAYGVEAKDVIERVEFWSTEDFQLHQIEGCACRFGYRDSIFKHELKKSAVITRVVFHLPKKASFTLTYPDLKAFFPEEGGADLGAVRAAVIAIRKRKLPDPRRLANAGSFFKNPSVAEADYVHLKRRYPAMPGFRFADGQWKIPAGWLVEQCGWLGFRDGDAGVSRDHALILVNHGCATGAQILSLAERIAASVVDRFGIALEPEVTILS
jgi:UDP-N-acetylmuramate dehydrogenase